MIHLQITHSNDPSRNGEYTFYQNAITIGADLNDNLFFDNDELLHQHISLFLDKKKLYLNLNSDLNYILVQGKRTTQKKILKKNDLIQCSHLTIKVIDFDEQKRTSRKEFLNNRSEKIKQTKPELLNIIQEFTE